AHGGDGGGGLFIGGNLFATTAGAATLINCTVSGNSANAGGGVYLDIGLTISATATLTNCTVSGNSAAASGGAFSGPGGGGLFIRGNASTGDGGTAYLNNTIVAGQSGGGDVSNSFGNLIGNNNLVGDGSGDISGSNNLLGTAANPIDPLLAPLGNYGGTTPTMALFPRSPALDPRTMPLFSDGGLTRQTSAPQVCRRRLQQRAYDDDI